MLELDDIKRAVTEVAQSLGAHQVILFGSYARGTATKGSDVDLIVVEDTKDRFLARLGKYLDPLWDRLRTGVEVLVYTPEEFGRMQEGAFLRRALREGIVLYESGKVPA
jgi:predicted nucleotidyltransferase